MDDHGPVRLDKWLWAARFFKTRSLATDAIDLGRVRLAGERIKPAREVRVGERYEITIGETRFEIVVRALSAVRGPAPVARTLYEETADSVERRQRRAEVRRFGAEPAQELKGRPTKRDGRLLRDLRGD
ncbi:MAG: RNA-binding S4 domain-containing protein [Burkholderiales bacterium]|jgi:ribosome-associated heat shock protein Hsp15|nr:RNA-binding S4 domain-containing protein [Burkholderiales bacterium]